MLALLVGWLALLAAPAPSGPQHAVEDPASAYRLRQVELALATGRVPTHDTFLGAGARAPWPPLVQAALARYVRAVEPETAGAAARGGLDPLRLEEHALHLHARLALLGALAAAAAAYPFARTRGAHGAVSRAALGCTLLLAALGALLLLERPGRPYPARVDAGAWLAPLACATLGLAAGALEARQIVDRMLTSLLAGLAFGLALITAVEVWPLGACVALFLARGPGARGDALRSALLFAMPACAVVLLAGGLPPWRAFAPTFDLGWEGMLATSGQLWLYGALFPLAAWTVWLRPRSPSSALLLCAAVVTFAFGLLDARFEIAFGVPMLLVISLALQELWIRTAGWSRAVALMLALCLLTLSAVRLHVSGGTSSPATAQLPAEDGFVSGLVWLRDNTPASGATNHPEAAQDWGVLCDPLQAGAVTWLARRPVVAASFRGAAVDERQRAAARAWLARDPAELVRAARELGAAYVVACARQIEDVEALRRIAGAGAARGPELAESALARLALAPADAPPDHFPGLERVHVTSGRERVRAARVGRAEVAAPAVSIYRVLPAPPTPTGLHAR